MPSSPVKLDAVTRLGTLLIAIVDVTTETIVCNIVCLSTLILQTPEIVPQAKVALLVGQDLLASGDHLGRVGELLAVQNERLAVLVQRSLSVVAPVLGCVHLLDRRVKDLHGSRQILINVILIGTDLFELGLDFRLQVLDIEAAIGNALLE